jgi:hypothetical protein
VVAINVLNLSTDFKLAGTSAEILRKGIAKVQNEWRVILVAIGSKSISM